MKHSDKRNFHLLATFVPRYLADHSNLIARIAHIVGYSAVRTRIVFKRWFRYPQHVKGGVPIGSPPISGGRKNRKLVR